MCSGSAFEDLQLLRVGRVVVLAVIVGLLLLLIPPVAAGCWLFFLVLVQLVLLRLAVAGSLAILLPLLGLFVLLVPSMPPWPRCCGASGGGAKSLVSILMKVGRELRCCRISASECASSASGCPKVGYASCRTSSSGMFQIERSAWQRPSRQNTFDARASDLPGQEIAVPDRALVRQNVGSLPGLSTRVLFVHARREPASY